MADTSGWGYGYTPWVSNTTGANPYQNITTGQSYNQWWLQQQQATQGQWSSPSASITTTVFPTFWGQNVKELDKILLQQIRDMAAKYALRVLATQGCEGLAV